MQNLFRCLILEIDEVDEWNWMIEVGIKRVFKIIHIFNLWIKLFILVFHLYLDRLKWFKKSLCICL